MITENNIAINTLKMLGFTASEIAVYKVLVENDYLTVNTISKLSNVPRTKTYEVLNKLELKKVIQKLEGYPIKYRAKDPIQTLKNMKKKLIEETEQGLELLQESWEQKESVDDLQPIAVYYGSMNYYKILKRIENDVKINLFILLKFLVAEDEILLVKNVIQANVRKGIKVELVLHPEVEETLDSSTKKFFRENTILHQAPIPIRALFIDNAELIIQVPADEQQEHLELEDIHNIIIRLPDLVKTIEKSIRATINQVFQA